MGEKPLQAARDGSSSEQRYPEPTVGAFILDPAGRFLFIRSHKWPGSYTVPGGHVELGERLVEALVREVKEETALDVYDPEFLCFQEFIYDDAFWKRRHFIFFDFACRTDSTAVQLNDEAQEYLWIRPEEALDLLLEPYAVVAVNEYLRRHDPGRRDRPAEVDASAIMSGGRRVVGLLGLPLGTVCRVAGAFLAGSELRQKAYDGVLLMRVLRVNGVELPQPVRLRFGDLHGGAPAGAAAGAPFDVLAYETGAYVGVPAEAWTHIPPAAASEHHLETSLVVLCAAGDSAWPGKAA